MSDSQILIDRFRASCKSLHHDVSRGFDAGDELLGILSLPGGRQAQFAFKNGIG